MHCSYRAGFESNCKGKRYIPLLDAHQTFSKLGCIDRNRKRVALSSPVFCVCVQYNTRKRTSVKNGEGLEHLSHE